METIRKSTGRASSVQGGLAVGAAVSTGITLIGTMLMAYLLDTQKMVWEQTGYGIMVMLFAASYLGAVIACRKIKRQRLLICGLNGLTYFGILLSITALFFGGQYSGVAVTALLVAGGSGCAALLGAEKGRRGHPRNSGKRLLNRRG